MPSPRFPAKATLMDARACPLDKFDALFGKITQALQPQKTAAPTAGLLPPPAYPESPR